MKWPVRATKPTPPKTANVRAVSLLLAGMIIAMAVCQLFSFEDYPGLIAGWWLPGDGATAQLLAVWIVVVEVAALPFLLMMYLSPLMRLVSMVCSWLVAATWLVISLWQCIVPHGTAESGLLGSTIPLPYGWWLVSFALALGALAAWASWGMWPVLPKRRRRKS